MSPMTFTILLNAKLKHGCTLTFDPTRCYLIDYKIHLVFVSPQTHQLIYNRLCGNGWNVFKNHPILNALQWFDPVMLAPQASDLMM